MKSIELWQFKWTENFEQVKKYGDSIFLVPHVAVLVCLELPIRWSDCWRGERSSRSYFLRGKNLDSLYSVRLQLDHNASRACNHNALRHWKSLWHVLQEFFDARKKPHIYNFPQMGKDGFILCNKLHRSSTKSLMCKRGQTFQILTHWIIIIQLCFVMKLLR